MTFWKALFPWASANLRGTIHCSNLCTEIIEYTSPDEVAVCSTANIHCIGWISWTVKQNRWMNRGSKVRKHKGIGRNGEISGVKTPFYVQDDQKDVLGSVVGWNILNHVEIANQWTTVSTIINHLSELINLKIGSFLGSKDIIQGVGSGPLWWFWIQQYDPQR